MTLTATNGAVTLVGTAGLAFSVGDGAGDATMTFTGTAVSINAALNGLSFNPTSSYSGPASLQIVTNDQGNTGAGGAQTDSDTVNITVSPVNDAPVLDNSGAMTLTTITEDDLASGGDTVADIIASAGGDRITDADSGAIEGIAITGLISGNGTWQYSTTGGASWNNVGAVANGSALLLRNTDLLRLVPDGQNGTAASLTFRAWDQTSGSAGTKVDASASGGATAFSTATETATIAVTAVNDAPVNSLPGAQSTSEDTPLVLSTGTGNLLSISDVDTGAGSLQVTLTATNGTVTLAGIAGLAFSVGDGTGDTSMTFTGTVASINTALDGLAFNPTGNYSGPASLQIVTSDQGNTGAGGTQTDSDTVNITVSPVNDAPVLDNSGTMSLTTITEDDLASSGDTVAAIIASAGGDRITDADSGAVEGIAITGLVSGNGTWQYSTNGGGSWNNVGAVSNNSALLLRDSDLLRLVPDGQNATAASLNFRAWDQTSGSAGTKVDTSTTGVTAFSTATETASITVTGVNDAPVNSVPGVQSTAEDTPLVLSSGTGNQISISDVDAGGNPLQVTLISANGTLTLATTTGLSFSVGDGIGDGTMTFTGTAASINNALDGLTFDPTGSFSGAASVQIVTSDQGNTGAGGALGDSDTVNITVSPVNDAPVLDNSGAMTLTTITEDDLASGGDTVAAIIATAGGDRITDADSGAVEGIAITGLVSGTGTWQYSTNGGGSWNNVGTVSTASALLLRDSDLLQLVPDGQNATAASLTFQAWDQTSGVAGTKVDASTSGSATAFSTATETATIAVTAVNDAPVLDSSGVMTLTTITEDDTANNGDAIFTIIASAGETALPMSTRRGRGRGDHQCRQRQRHVAVFDQWRRKLERCRRGIERLGPAAAGNRPLAICPRRSKCNGGQRHLPCLG